MSINKQIAKESLEWHIISLIMEGLVVLAWTGKLLMSIGIVIVSFILKSIVYYFYRNFKN
jgi:uncharacterized membrane protein